MIRNYLSDTWCTLGPSIANYISDTITEVWLTRWRHLDDDPAWCRTPEAEVVRRRRQQRRVSRDQVSPWDVDNYSDDDDDGVDAIRRRLQSSVNAESVCGTSRHIANSSHAQTDTINKPLQSTHSVARHTTPPENLSINSAATRSSATAEKQPTFLLLKVWVYIH